MANSKDPFAAYAVPSPQVEAGTDPFAEFAVAPPTPKAADPFAQYAVSPAQPTPPSTPGLKRYQELTKERNEYGLGDLIRPGAVAARGGVFSTKTTPASDLEALAEGTGVDKETAVALGPLLGAMPPLEEMSLSKAADVAAGRLNYALGNLPAFVAKKIATDDPNVRRFIDEARELAEGRMGAVEFVGWNFAPVGKLIKFATSTGEALKAPTIAKQAGEAIGTGTVYGVAGSKEGTEKESALVGATIGGVLGGVAAGIAKARTPKDIDPTTKEISTKFFKNNEADIETATKEAYGKVEKSTDAMADAIVNNRPLTREEANLIIEEQLKPDTVDVFKEKLINDYKKTRAPEEKDLPIPEAVTDELAIANEITAQRKKIFANQIAEDVPGLKPTEDISAKESLEAVLDRAKALGEDYLKDEFRRKMAIEVGESALDKLNIKIGPGSFSVGKQIANGMGDRQYGFIVADERAGGRLYPKFLRFMEQNNLLTAERHDYQKRMNDLYGAAKDIGVKKDVRDAKGSNFFRAMDSEQYDTLPPEQQKLATDIRDFFDTMRWRGNTIEGPGITPLNIAKKEGFGLPHMTVEPAETAIRFNEKLAEVERYLGDIEILKDTTNVSDFIHLSNTIPALDELRRGVNLFSDTPVTNGPQLLSALKIATSSGGASAKVQTTASTVFQRKDAIPDFLREKDIFKLMGRYSENILRNVYYRNTLKDMLVDAAYLDKIKAKPEAEFVRRFVADNLGIREFSMARLGNESRIALAKSLDAGLEKVITNPEERKKIVDGLRLLPELGASLQHNIYPNVLALNPRSHLSQLTQVLFKNAPELGGVYGYETAVKSMMEVMLNWKKLGVRMEEVAERGLEPKSFLREASESLASSAEQTLLYNTPAKALRTMSDAAMWSYGKMNTLNIAVTRNMASRILDDITAGSSAAFKAVNKMPTSIRRTLVENQGNREAQQKILESYLTSVTQYQYNRAAMSELGVVAGPFFSTFTKWPLATAGDIAAEIRTKGIQKGLPRVVEKYAAIWLLAAAVDVTLYKIATGDWERDPDMKEVGDRAKKILGAGGVRSMAPIESVGGLLSAAGLGAPTEKGMFTPPVIDALFNGVVKPVYNGDSEQLTKGGMKALTTFAPGGYLYRILMQDIPTYVTGEKPPAPWEK